MLVLSRHRDEGIVIGDGIEITVVDIRGDKVRIGITAPSHIQVHRKEVYEDIRQENEQASEFHTDELHLVKSEASQPLHSQPIAAAVRLDENCYGQNRRSA